MSDFKLTRRSLLAASLGAAQLALLDRFSWRSSARACERRDGPTRLLVLHLRGGVRFYPSFVPMRDEEIPMTIPPPTSALSEPAFFRPEDVIALSGDSGGFMPLRMGARWNSADPGARGGYSPMGYSWLHYDLAPNTAVLHGVDQGSLAHAAAYVAAMCGVPGQAYRAPALVSVVANHLHARFGRERPIPCIAINGHQMPQAPNLPASASPALVPSAAALGRLFTSDSARHARWRNADARTAREVPDFDGRNSLGAISLTNVDGLTLERTRTLGQRANEGNRGVLERIFGSYAAVSRTLANDVVTAVEEAVPTTVEKPDHLRAYGMYDFTFGAANGRIDMTESCEWILRLMKSNVTSAVYASLPERSYDYHSGSTVPTATVAVQAQLDIIARMMGEMKATPSPDRAGRTLYDDTLVVIQSEFGRSWPRGPNQDEPARWTYGDDHNAMTSVILSGGGISGNRQIGGYEAPSRGEPVSIRESSGETSRPPRAADLVTTVYDLFGIGSDDVLIPGAHGIIRGLCD